MIDPGHPFAARTYASLIDALVSSVRDGVLDTASDELVFRASVPAYDLSRIAYGIERITAVAGGRLVVFTPGTDYGFEQNRVVWRDGPGAQQPPDGGRFTVDYSYRLPSAGLTDFNPGSVIGTLLRAVGRELKALYAQMDEAYRRAFLDVATGVALDNVVALVGLVRHEARKATGEVTFTRKKPASDVFVIRAGTRVADGAGRLFVTTADATIAVGASSVTVSVEAMEAGPNGNVNTGAVVVMPTPPRGVDGVSNANPISGGDDPEPDDRLRDRARHALDRAGRATLDAIKYAVLEIDGVDGVTVLDSTADDTIPLGEVRVRFASAAGDAARRAAIRSAVEAVVEQTRAAGIKARIETIRSVLVAGTIYAIPDKPARPGAEADLRDAILHALEAQVIGEPLLVRKLVSLGLGVPGIADVAEAQLTARPDGGSPGPVTDPLVIAATDQIRPDAAGLKTVALKGLKVAGVVEAGSSRQVALQLTIPGASGDVAAPLAGFALDVAVVVKAKLVREPDRPSERIGRFTRRLSFAPGATLTVTPADVPDFRPADHDPNGAELTVSAALYPGLAAAVASMKVPV